MNPVSSFASLRMDKPFRSTVKPVGAVFAIFFPMIITCPRCEESGDPDSSLFDDGFTEDSLTVGDRFVRDTPDDAFYCVICERKGIYCEAEIQDC